MNTQREFVQLKEHYIADITLKFANGLKKEGQFGPYLLYSVLHEGKEKFLKVTDRLEKQFRKFDVKAGQVVSLLKETITPKNGEPFTVINVLECKDAPKPEKKEKLIPQKVESAQPIPQTSEDFSGDALTMYQSLHDAVDITKTIEGVEWRNTDIEKIGVCLFLSRTGQLTVDKVLSNGNGNGLSAKSAEKRSHRLKKVEDVKPIPVPEKVQEMVPVSAEAAVEKDDLPF